MAIEDKYINPERADDKKEVPAFINGAEVVCVIAKFEVAAGDDNGSIFRLARLNAKMIIVKAEIFNDAITNGTDYDLGIYKALASTSGAVKIKDVFGNALDLSAAHASGSPLSGLSALDVNDLQKKLYEHAGDSLESHDGEYDVALTGNAVGTASGTICAKLYFVQG